MTSARCTGMTCGFCDSFKCMNGYFSYNWLKQYAKFSETPEAFAERVSLSGPAVERILPAAPDLQNIVVGLVESVDPHPNADRLRVAKTKIGKRKTVEIVCGGSNLVEGQWVAVALPGSRVLWHGEGEPVTLEETEIRGVKSVGMIAAAVEIGLADAFPAKEREILDLGDAFDTQDLEPGTPLETLLGFEDDVLFDMEVTTNRVDAMGVIGMAREAAAILERPFTWKPVPLPKSSATDEVKVTVHDPDLCPRYMAVRVDDVRVGPSSWWLKKRLMSAGLNSINNVVDITNLILLEHAQPLHAFDAEHVHGGINVRRAKKGEKITALGGVVYDLTPEMLVIADDEEPIAIAGVKGGEFSGVTAETTSVIIEAATFDPVSVRRTGRALGLQSDAQQRYEKGLSTEALEYALARAVKLLKAECGGKVASKITDVRATPYVANTFEVTETEVRTLMGVDISQKEMTESLRRLGFGVAVKGETMSATVPWWRDADIESGRDLVEEIARVHGYANIPPDVPVGVAPRDMDAELVWEDRVRTVMEGAGFTETYSYSFVSEALMEKTGFDPSSMLRVQNELSSDHVLMRTTLLPSLLQIASENRELQSEIRLFEVANVYYPPAGTKKSKNGSTWMDLPDEQLELGALIVGVDEPWRHAKGVVEHMLHEMGLQGVVWKRISNEAFWHPGRTAQAFIGDTLIATVGEVNPKIARAFKLDRVGCIHMPLEFVTQHATSTAAYVPVSSYPPVLRDVAILVHYKVEFADVAREIMQIDPLVSGVEWFDTYRGKGVPQEKKSLAVHLTFSSPDRTLESDEIESIMERISLMLKEKFKGEVR